MPLPGKKPPRDFVCLHRNYCPHLDGLSTGWVWNEYVNSGIREDEDARTIRELEVLLEEAEQRIYGLEKRNEELCAKLAALHKSRFKSNRKKKKKTSSEQNPPDDAQSDKLSEPKDAKPKGSRGAPKGHPGWSRPKPDRVDRTISVSAPSICPECGADDLSTVEEIRNHIQEDIVLQPRTVVTCFKHQQAICPCCRKVVIQPAEGELLNCPIGPQAKAASVFLRNGIGISYRRVQDIMGVLFGMHFVPASAMAFDRKAAQAGEPVYDVLLEKLRSAPVAFGDETSWREDGNSAYVWYGGNEQVALYNIVPSRGGQAAVYLFGENFPGVLHTDGYAGYNAVNAEYRQTCLGHHITKAKELSAQLDLIPAEMRDARSVRLCRIIKSFFQQTCVIAKRFHSGLIPRNKASLFENRLVSTLKSICADPCEFEAAETFRAKLLDPEREHNRLFTFLHHEGVHPTNNHSEQSIRWLVIFRKLCFGTRSKAGSRSLSVLASLIVTGRRHGLHPLDLTLALFTRSSTQVITCIFDPDNAPDSLINKPP